MASSSITVLVTGGSGWIGSYVILALLSEGYTVRTTIRSLSRKSRVREALTNGGATPTDLERLSFFAASLDSDDGWAEAVKNCTYVHHVASPFPAELPKHEDELILPARDGTLRVFKAAVAASVKRVIMTSSYAAVGYGHPPRKEPFTEEDWSCLDGEIPLTPYMKSKTVAEKAAWDFIKSDQNKSKMELAVIVPLMVSGPILSKDISTSVEVFKKLMDGSMPGAPNLSYIFVDVRDVASLHMIAMKNADAAGQRLIAGGNESSYSMLDIAKVIKAKRPEKAKKVPSFQLPNLLIHGLALFDKPVRQILPDLGKKPLTTNKKARGFGWTPRPAEESFLDTVDSLVKYGVVQQC